MSAVEAVRKVATRLREKRADNINEAVLAEAVEEALAPSSSPLAGEDGKARSGPAGPLAAPGEGYASSQDRGHPSPTSTSASPEEAKRVSVSSPTRGEEGADLASAELDRHAGIHRRAVAAYGQRAADTKAEGRNEIAAIRASRKTLRENHTIALDALKRAHAAELAALDDQEAAVRCETEERVAVNRRLAAASRAALAALEAE